MSKSSSQRPSRSSARQADLFRADIHERAKVAKGNELVYMGNEWTAFKQDVVALLISQIRKDDEDFMQQRLYVKDLRRFYPEGGGLYERLRDVADELLDEKIIIEHEGADSWEKWNLMSGCRYRPGEGYVEAVFNQDMRPFLLQLKGNFTQYELRIFVSLSGQYAKRIYELLKDFESMRDEQYYEAERLRKMLGCQDKYSRPRDFRKRVLKPAIDEINEKTDLKAEYEDKREGRTIVGYWFRILDRTDEKGEKSLKVGAPRVLSAPPRSPDDRDRFDEWWEDLDVKDRRALVHEANQAIDERDTSYSPMMREVEVQRFLRRRHSDLVDEESSPAASTASKK